MVKPDYRSVDDELVQDDSLNDHEAGSVAESARGWGVWVTKGVVLAALIAPVFERRGYWDHWLSWSLYSPHTSRVELEVHRTAIDQLPGSVRPYVRPDRDGDGWRTIDLAGWSLAMRRVPIYPQSRYQLAIALHLAQQTSLQQEVRARLRSASDRWSGRRKDTLLIGREELQQAAEAFWLHAG